MKIAWFVSAGSPVKRSSTSNTTAVWWQRRTIPTKALYDVSQLMSLCDYFWCKINCQWRNFHPPCFRTTPASLNLRSRLLLSTMSSTYQVWVNKLSHGSNCTKSHKLGAVNHLVLGELQRGRGSGSYFGKMYIWLFPVCWSAHSMMKKPWLMLWPGSTQCPSPSKSCLTLCTTRKEFTAGQLLNKHLSI